GAGWEPVMLTLSSGEAASFTVRVFQESGGVYTAERVWRKFRLTLFMTPTSADSNAIYAPLVNATIFPGTSREETQSAADVIWGDETAVVSFEFESPDTYGSHTAEIPVSLLLDTTVCYVDDTVQECDVEWNVTATVTLEVEWLDYQYYIPGEQSKVLYPARLDPLVGVGGGGDIASLYLPPGSTGSSEAYLLVAPLPMAALFENITGSSISEPRYNFSITLYAKPAPGDYFPGGTLHLQLPGLGGCEAQLPPMSPGSEELVSCEIDNISLASLWDYLTGRIIEGLLWANTSEPASSGVSLVVGVPGGQGSVSPVSLTGIPIVNVPFNAGSEDEGWVLTPIARYNDSSLAGYLALTPTARLAAVEQPRVKDGPYVRWAPLQVVLSSRSSNLHLEVSLAASQFESQLYSYAPAGRMTWFTAKFTLSGLDSCEEGSVEVYGLSREGGTPSQLERYLEVAARVVGWMSRVVESLKRVSDALNIAVYILKYKSITQVETSYACSGGTATYWVNATQTGWQPDGFEDDVHIALYESLNTVDCASSSIYLALGTQHIASLGSYTYPSTRVCLPSALSSGGGG
ncbi:MAG: hypothetical protein LRS49_02480, partial [Desulfurococcales archaeon]|nr:hypothetical protein [Desulfurococcales archaeon]